jgi:outer membrane receptor for ferrienterochelin and colicins
VEATADAGPGEVSVRALGQDYDHAFRSARGATPIAGTEELQTERLWEGALGYAAVLGAHEVDVGVESARRAIESPDKLLEDRASDSQVELFGQEAWTVGRVVLSGGARLTLNDRWGNTASPSAGLSALASDGLRLRATLGRGFRAPSFKELAWDFANVGAGYTVEGFADLRPERSWSASAGVDWAPAARLSLSGEVYSNQIDDLIEFAFIGNATSGLLVYSPRNVRQARTRGFEVSAEARAGRATVLADYAFLDARSVEDDLPLDRRARHSGRVRLGGDADLLAGLRVDLTAHVTGDAPLVGLDELGRPATIGTQEAFVSLDTQFTLQLPASLRLVVGVDNLLDAQPEGWQATIGRRLRTGIEVRDVL